MCRQCATAAHMHTADGALLPGQGLRLSRRRRRRLRAALRSAVQCARAAHNPLCSLHPVRSDRIDHQQAAYVPLLKHCPSSSHAPSLSTHVPNTLCAALQPTEAEIAAAKAELVAEAVQRIVEAAGDDLVTSEVVTAPVGWRACLGCLEGRWGSRGMRLAAATCVQWPEPPPLQQQTNTTTQQPPQRHNNAKQHATTVRPALPRDQPGAPLLRALQRVPQVCVRARP